MNNEVKRQAKVLSGFIINDKLEEHKSYLDKIRPWLLNLNSGELIDLHECIRALVEETHK